MFCIACHNFCDKPAIITNEIELNPSDPQKPKKYNIYGQHTITNKSQKLVRNCQQEPFTLDVYRNDEMSKVKNEWKF